MMKPCVICGTVSEQTRCTEHQLPSAQKPAAAARGYDAAWTKLSKRARAAQPFCLHCGTTTDLQTDHTPEAWARKAAGKPIRLSDVQVLCGACNRAAGQARPGANQRPGEEGASDPRQTPLLRQSLNNSFGRLSERAQGGSW